MIPTIAVIAERAQVRADGKLDVVGVYNCRYASELPGKIDVTLAVRFDIEPLDYGAKQRISVHIVDEDGNEMVNLTATPVTFDSPSVAGLPARLRSRASADRRFPARRHVDVRRARQRSRRGEGTAASRATGRGRGSGLTQRAS